MLIHILRLLCRRVQLLIHSLIIFFFHSFYQHLYPKHDTECYRLKGSMVTVSGQETWFGLLALIFAKGEISDKSLNLLSLSFPTGGVVIITNSLLRGTRNNNYTQSSACIVPMYSDARFLTNFPMLWVSEHLGSELHLENSPARAVLVCSLSVPDGMWLG